VQVGQDLLLTSLKNLPENFTPTVNGKLNLASVTTIPAGFQPTIGENGHLDLSSITAIPDGFSPILIDGDYSSAQITIPAKFLGEDYDGTRQIVASQFNRTFSVEAKAQAAEAGKLHDTKASQERLVSKLAEGGGYLEKEDIVSVSGNTLILKNDLKVSLIVTEIVEADRENEMQVFVELAFEHPEMFKEENSAYPQKSIVKGRWGWGYSEPTQAAKDECLRRAIDDSAVNDSAHKISSYIYRADEMAKRAARDRESTVDNIGGGLLNRLF
jgi:hypothetical protein